MTRFRPVRICDQSRFPAVFTDTRFERVETSDQASELAAQLGEAADDSR